MQNPWQHSDVPDDGAVRRSRPWVKIAGMLIWLTVISVTGVLLFTDVGGERATAVMVQMLQLTVATTAMCLIGWIAQRILRRLRLLGGTLINIFPVLFLFALPILVGVVAHQLGFLSGGLSAELAEIVPVKRWQEQVTRRAIGPIKDVLPWT